ncbi:MAG: glycosyltransferase family 4 protein [Desulfofustis sp.]|nr:glycosyltransferase family 4 protein [Desulfofustis sp.]
MARRGKTEVVRQPRTAGDGPDGRARVVVHIAPTPFFANRGCHIRILNEYEALRRAGIRVIVCTYGLGSDVADVDIRRIWSIPGYRKTTAGFSPFKPLADVLLFFLCLRVVLCEHADIIHGHLHEGGLIGWCVKTILFWRRIPLIMDIQGSLSGELRAYGTFRHLPLLLRFFSWLERLILRLPDRIICSSRASFAFIVNTALVAEKDIEMVGDVVPASFFTVLDKRTQRERLHLSPDGIIVIYSGSLLPGKGIDVLLESMRLVARSHPAISFVLVGYPKEAVEQSLRGWDNAPRVVLPGEVPYRRLAEWLAVADLAVDPKDSESGEASGKILHYMASGLPVVCFSSENNRRFLGEHGFFAAGKSATDLASAMDLALTDERARHIYGALGRERAAAEYSQDAVGRQLHVLYDSLT